MISPLPLVCAGIRNRFATVRSKILRSPMVRISDSHSGDPGSIPGEGVFFSDRGASSFFSLPVRAIICSWYACVCMPIFELCAYVFAHGVIFFG